MKQGKIKSLIDTGQEVGEKLKYNVFRILALTL